MNYYSGLSLLLLDVLNNSQGNEADASTEKEIIKNDLFFVSDKRICIGNTTYSLQNISSVGLSEFQNKPKMQGCGQMIVLTCIGIWLLSLGGFMIILGVAFFLFLYFGHALEQNKVKLGTYTVFNVKISDSSGQKNVFATRSKQDADLLVTSINQAMIMR